MIERGEKTEEYREITPYWIQRIGLFDAVRFRYGYTKRTMLFQCKDIRIGIGRKDWGAPEHKVFIIKVGERLNNS